VRVRAAEVADEPAWREMWAGYCAFYRIALPDAVTDATWSRILDPVSEIGALIAVDGSRSIGFANYVVHPYTWSASRTCYLEDLFVRADARGAGAGRALIERLLELGGERGWDRVYWHTHAGNSVARALYDSFCERDEFVRYVLPIPSR
jgi:GNAT superfamily N-acetyltransferase